MGQAGRAQQPNTIQKLRSTIEDIYLELLGQGLVYRTVIRSRHSQVPLAGVHELRYGALALLGAPAMTAFLASIS